MITLVQECLDKGIQFLQYVAFFALQTTIKSLDHQLDSVFFIFNGACPAQPIVRTGAPPY